MTSAKRAGRGATIDDLLWEYGEAYRRFMTPAAAGEGDVDRLVSAVTAIYEHIATAIREAVAQPYRNIAELTDDMIDSDASDDAKRAAKIIGARARVWEAATRPVPEQTHG